MATTTPPSTALAELKLNQKAKWLAKKTTGLVGRFCCCAQNNNINSSYNVYTETVPFHPNDYDYDGSGDGDGDDEESWMTRMEDCHADGEWFRRRGEEFSFETCTFAPAHEDLIHEPVKASTMATTTRTTRGAFLAGPTTLVRTFSSRSGSTLSIPEKHQGTKGTSSSRQKGSSSRMVSKTFRMKELQGSQGIHRMKQHLADDDLMSIPSIDRTVSYCSNSCSDEDEQTLNSLEESFVQSIGTRETESTRTMTLSPSSVSRHSLSSVPSASSPKRFVFHSTARGGGFGSNSSPGGGYGNNNNNSKDQGVHRLNRNASDVSSIPSIERTISHCSSQSWDSNPVASHQYQQHHSTIQHLQGRQDEQQIFISGLRSGGSLRDEASVSTIVEEDDSIFEDVESHFSIQSSDIEKTTTRTTTKGSTTKTSNSSKVVVVGSTTPTKTKTAKTSSIKKKKKSVPSSPPFLNRTHPGFARSGTSGHPYTFSC